jgi:hypothetical protein
MEDFHRQRPSVSLDRRWSSAQIEQELEGVRSEMSLGAVVSDSDTEALAKIAIAVDLLKSGQLSRAAAPIFGAIGVLELADHQDPLIGRLHQVLDHLGIP